MVDRFPRAEALGLQTLRLRREGIRDKVNVRPVNDGQVDDGQISDGWIHDGQANDRQVCKLG